MDVRLHTHDYLGKSRGKAESLAGKECSILSIDDGKGNKVDIFGPPTAKEEFDQITKLFNDAHKNEALLPTTGEQA